jgi:hypothetical protein
MTSTKTFPDAVVDIRDQIQELQEAPQISLGEDLELSIRALHDIIMAAARRVNNLQDELKRRRA